MPSGVYERSEKQKLDAANRFREQAALKKGKKRPPFSEETKRKMSEKRAGRKPWNAGKTGIYSEETINKIKIGRKKQIITIEIRKKISNTHKVLVKEGKCHLYRGGIYPKNLAIRKSLEYKLWRESVFKRDGYKCVKCGSTKSGGLEADHIKAFSLYPELRFDINNGRTLCKKCHRETDTYGFNMKTIENKAGAKIPKGKAAKSEGNSNSKRHGERG